MNSELHYVQVRKEPSSKQAFLWIRLPEGGAFPAELETRMQSVDLGRAGGKPIHDCLVGESGYRILMVDFDQADSIADEIDKAMRKAFGDCRS